MSEESIKSKATDILAPFCSRYDDLKIFRPFVKGHYRWATDGVILARVPTEEPDTDPSTVDGHGRLPIPLSVWHDFKDQGEFISEPIAIEKFICWACHGVKQIRVESEVYVEDDRHPCPCCDECGSVWIPRYVFIGVSILSAVYIDMIQQLPGWKICVPVDGEQDKAMSFMFDGGEGMLMPCNQKTSDGAVDVDGSRWKNVRIVRGD